MSIQKVPHGRSFGPMRQHWDVLSHDQDALY